MRQLIGWAALILLLLPACTTTQAVAQAETPASKPTETAEVPVYFGDPQPTASQPGPPPTASPTAAPTSTPTPAPLPRARQITTGNCCTGLYWNEESTEVRFIDRPSAGDSAGIWGVNVTQLDTRPYLVTERLGRYSQDGALLAYPDQKRGLVIVERLADGQVWEIDTQGGSLSFTPDNGLIWTVYDNEVSWQARQGEIWLADTDGSQARRLITLQRGGPVAWLSDTELLVSTRRPPAQDTVLSRLSIDDGTLTELIQLPRIRGVLFSPDRRYLVYMTRFEENLDNGLWLLDLQARPLQPEPLPFFGSYRWRDHQRLIYIPFDPEAKQHIFYQYDVQSRESHPLFPPGEESNAHLLIANNEWQVSPDGSKIALVAAAKSDTLDGIWVIEIGQE